MPDRPSSAPPDAPRHTYEEARAFSLEEQKRYCAEVFESITHVRADLKVIVSLLDEQEREEQRTQTVEPMTKRLSDLVQKLRFPIDNETFEAVKSQAMLDSVEKEVTWEDIVSRYGNVDLTPIVHAVVAYENDPSDDNIRALRQVLKSAGHKMKAALVARGGNSHDRMIEVYNDLDLDEATQWHGDFLGHYEKILYAEQLGKLVDRFGIEYGDLIIEDRGCGTGRCLHQLNELAHEGLKENDTQVFPPLSDDERLELLSGYHGVDIMPENVAKTREAFMELLGLASMPNHSPIQVGDFRKATNPDRLEPGSAHLIMSMMRTIFHNLTEDDLADYLRQVARDLAPGTDARPGGMFVFDSVELRRLDDHGDEKVRESLYDLMNLYTQLWWKYARENQKLMPDHIDLKRMPRRHIYDNTSGVNFYWREVIDHRYVQHVIEKHGIDLEYIGKKMRTPKRKHIEEHPEINTDDITSLGRKMVHDNNLESHLRTEIARRMEAGELSPDVMAKMKDSAGDIDILFDHAAHNMVMGFSAEHYIFQRPKRNGETDHEEE